MEIVAGFDPGKSTGFAIIQVLDKKITPMKIGVIKEGPNALRQFQEVLCLGVTHAAIEDFLVRPGQARKGAFDWDSMVAPRVIERLKTLCELQQIPFVLQQPAIKPVGYGFANQKYRAGKKGTHSEDAIAHAVYYAVKVLGAHPVGNF